MKRGTRALAGALTLLGAACSTAPTRVPDPPETPATFAGAAEAGSYEPQEWWRAFRDPVLDEVVDAVLGANFSVAEAVARVEQARTRARLADAAVLPVIGARAGATSFSQPTGAAIGAQLDDLGLDFPLPERLGFTTYALAAEFSYELDFWGRVRHRALAAGSELLASEFDLLAARIGILSETIATYLEIDHLRRQVAIASEQVGVLREREQLAERRYERGLSSSAEYYAVRRARNGAEAGVPLIENQLAEAESRLAVLLGGYRDDVEAILPDSARPEPATDPVPVGIPAALLMQRPDVQAAGHRLEAASHTVEAHRAALMPQLSLSGSIGLQSVEADGLFDVKQWFANLAGNLFRPLFDGDRLGSQVELAEARFDELAAAYGRVVVTAVNEVEAALIHFENGRRRHESLTAEHADAEAARDLHTARYESGVGGYADLLDATRALLDAESALAQSERNLALARLAIHRALGGAWTPLATEDTSRAGDSDR